MLGVIKEKYGESASHSPSSYPKSAGRISGQGGIWVKSGGRNVWVKTGETLNDALLRIKNFHEKFPNRRKAGEAVQEEPVSTDPEFALGIDEEDIEPYTRLKKASGLVQDDEDFVEELRRYIKPNRRELIQIMFELARGIWYEKKVKNGSIKIYRMPPDKDMVQYLSDQFWGKAKPRTKAAGEDKKNDFNFNVKDVA